MKKIAMFIIGVGLLMAVIACSSQLEAKEVTASSVVDHLLEQGLEAESSRDMKPADYGPLPQNAVSAQVFYLPTTGEKVNGHVFVFSSQEDMQEVIAEYAKYEAVVKVWLFEKDNVLLHLSGMVSEVDAKDYEQALNSL